VEGETVGSRVRRLRKEHGWSQDQLAERTKLSKSFLSEIETGTEKPRGPNLVLLAQALGTSIDYLMTGKEPELEPPPNLDVPAALAKVAERLDLPFAHVAMLREMYGRIEARRRDDGDRELSEADWERFYAGIKHLLPGKER
jgi:transcriptional regulator with XRE-family HTH domain